MSPAIGCTWKLDSYLASEWHCAVDFALRMIALPNEW
jgi:hypothetical protein